MHIPTEAELADRRACQGKDPLEAAVNWARHILDRDFEYPEVRRALVVVEVGRGLHARTFYATHRTDASGVEVRGLLSEALRGQTELVTRSNRHHDIDTFAKALAPQLEGLVFSKAQQIVGDLEDILEKSGHSADALLDAFTEEDLTPAALRRIASHIPTLSEDEEPFRRQLIDFANSLEKVLAEAAEAETEKS